MMKKILSFVLAIFMLIGILPVTAMTSAIDNAILIFVEPTMEYFIVGGFAEGLARVEKNEKCGFIDETGKLVVPLEYDSDRYSHFSEGLALVYKGGNYITASQRIRDGGKCGFIDKTGKVVIPFEYDSGTAFSEGLAAVEKNGKAYLINKNGEIVADLDDYFGDNEYYHEGLTVQSFSEGMAVVSKDGKYGFIDKTGKEVIPVGKYESTYDSFSEGLTIAGERVPTGDEDYYKKYGTDSYYVYYGYIDKTREIVIPREYDLANSFSEGLVSVSKDGKWGVIDTTGKIVIPFEYDDIGIFSEGLVSFNKDVKQGYIDKTGKVIISLDYDYERASFAGDALSPFHNGFAIVHSKLPADDAKEEHYEHGNLRKMGRYR